MDFNPFDAHNEINGQRGNGRVVIRTSASSKRVNVSVKSAVSSLYYTVSQKNAPTLKQCSSKLEGSILMTFGRNIQNTLE